MAKVKAEAKAKRVDAGRRTAALLGAWMATAIATAMVWGSMLLPGSAGAVTLSFDGLGLVHGEVVSAFDGVTIEATNPNRSFDYAVVFDSEASGTRDLDLEAATGGATRWSGGNLEGVELGMMLILQENGSGCDSGVCLNADDEGSRPSAGELRFIFDVPVTSFGFDLIDVDSTTAENGSVTFKTGSGGSATIAFADFLAGFEVGDNTANRIDAFTASSVGLADEIFTEVTIAFGGSGAIDNVTFVPTPEPSTVLFLGVGLAGLAARRRS